MKIKFWESLEEGKSHLERGNWDVHGRGSILTRLSWITCLHIPCISDEIYLRVDYLGPVLLHGILSPHACHIIDTYVCNSMQPPQFISQKRLLLEVLVCIFLHSHNYEHLLEFINDNILLKDKNLYLAHTHVQYLEFLQIAKNQIAEDFWTLLIQLT